MSLESKFIFNGAVMIPNEPLIKICGEFNYNDEYDILGNMSEDHNEFNPVCGCLLEFNALSPRYNLNILILNSSFKGKIKDLYFLSKEIDNKCGIYDGLVVPSSESFNYLNKINLSGIIEYLAFMCDEKKQKDVKLNLTKIE
jgi:hypothetical protein